MFKKLEIQFFAIRVLLQSVLKVCPLVRVLPVFHLYKRKKVLWTMTFCVKWLGRIHFE